MSIFGKNNSSLCSKKLTIPQGRHPKLGCLSEGNLTYLRHLFECFETAEQRFIGGKAHQEARQKARQQLRTSPEMLGGARAAIAWIKRNKPIEQRHEWRLATQRSLNSPDTWKAFFGRVADKDKAALARLKGRWWF